MFIYTLCTKLYMLSFKTQKSTKVTDIQIVIRLTGWMPHKDINLVTLEKKYIHNNKRSNHVIRPFLSLLAL